MKLDLIGNRLIFTDTDKRTSFLLKELSPLNQILTKYLVKDSGGTYIVDYVDTPVAMPKQGIVSSGTSVELSCATKNATIYYTLDGTDPTTNSTEYTTAIKLTQDTTIKAFAVANGYLDSKILRSQYLVHGSSEGGSIELKNIVFSENPVSHSSNDPEDKVYCTATFSYSSENELAHLMGSAFVTMITLDTPNANEQDFKDHILSEFANTENFYNNTGVMTDLISALNKDLNSIHVNISESGDDFTSATVSVMFPPIFIDEDLKDQEKKEELIGNEFKIIDLIDSIDKTSEESTIDVKIDILYSFSSPYRLIDSEGNYSDLVDYTYLDVEELFH